MSKCRYCNGVGYCDNDGFAFEKCEPCNGTGDAERHAFDGTSPVALAYIQSMHDLVARQQQTPAGIELRNMLEASRDRAMIRPKP